MTKEEEFDVDVDEDPELVDDPEEGLGGDEHYDGLAVQTIEFDPAQFELPDDFEIAEEGDDVE